MEPTRLREQLLGPENTSSLRPWPWLALIPHGRMRATAPRAADDHTTHPYTRGVKAATAMALSIIVSTTVYCFWATRCLLSITSTSFVSPFPSFLSLAGILLYLHLHYTLTLSIPPTTTPFVIAGVQPSPTALARPHRRRGHAQCPSPGPAQPACLPPCRRRLRPQSPSSLNWMAQQRVACSTLRSGNCGSHQQTPRRSIL